MIQKIPLNCNLHFFLILFLYIFNFDSMICPWFLPQKSKKFKSIHFITHIFILTYHIFGAAENSLEIFIFFRFRNSFIDSFVLFNMSRIFQCEFFTSFLLISSKSSYPFCWILEVSRFFVSI